MPMSTNLGRLQPRELRQAEQSVAEAEAELRQRQADAERIRSEAAEQAKAEQARRREAQRTAAERLASLERDAKAAIAQAATLAADARPDITPGCWPALLMGNLRGGEDQGGPHALVLSRDEAAALLFGANQQAATTLAWMTGEGLGGDITAKADRVECGLWGAFMRRLRQLAGEVP